MECIKYRRIQRAKKRSKKIHEAIRLETKRKERAVDVLILGTEANGKEKFLQQIRELVEGLDKPECRSKEKREVAICKETMYIHETCFIFNDRDYRMIDLSCDVSISKTKWIHCLEDVNIVIFLLDLSQYDTLQEEGLNKGHILESLLLFEEICNSPCFMEKSVILYLGSDTTDDVKAYILTRLKDLDRNHEYRKTEKQIICNCNLLTILNDISEMCPVAEDFESTTYKEPGICDMSASDLCLLSLFYCVYCCCMKCCCPNRRNRFF